jgi:hypothetical protein
MDLRVSEDITEISKTLTDLRQLVRDVVLPEILKTQEELQQLREVTWPVCQALIESSQLTNIGEKIKFLNALEHSDAMKLLISKNEFSKNALVSKSTSHLLIEELKRIGM